MHSTSTQMHASVEEAHYRFTGLTWDHPRGYQALEKAAQEDHQALLCWKRQPLEGFESHSIEKLAADYDLLILDHPHIGEAVAHDCLLPLDELFSPQQLETWSQQSIGASMASYAWHGKQWALPLDVATQVMALRSDLRQEDIPLSWEHVAQRTPGKKLALSLAGPHAFLTLLSITASYGHLPRKDDLLLSDAGFEQGLALLQQLYSQVPAWTIDLNPIGLLEAMSRGNEINIIPLVYGYVNYTRGDNLRQPLLFRDAPTGSAKYPGSVLGGTGIALTRRAKMNSALLEHLSWLMSTSAQCQLIPENEGQPSHRSAWLSDEVNSHCSNFYRMTLQTTENALVRPRFNGYIAFQNHAAHLIREALANQSSISSTIDQIRQIWRQALSAAKF